MSANTTTHSADWTSRQATIIPPQRREDVIENELDEQALLYDPLNGSMHRFNETALAVWRLCDGRAATRDIAEKLTDVYDLGFDAALDHVEQLVTLFAQLQLLDLSDSS